jgi:uncharacterized membrane protein YeaQ/YmgE (transglycosylase-associated protein family)
MTEGTSEKALKSLEETIRTATDQSRTSSHHALDNEIFEEYVKSDKDIVGMLAYCFYKAKKVRLCRENPRISSDEILERCKISLKPREYETTRARAYAALGHLQNRVISDYARRKNRRDWFVGIIAGIVAALLAPWIYSAIDFLIIKSDVVHSLPAIHITLDKPPIPPPATPHPSSILLPPPEPGQ